MRHWTPNQKLTPEQIATLKHLSSSGVRLNLLGQVIKNTYGVSVSTVYYHCSPNREAYDLRARKTREAQRLRTKERIHNLLQMGYNTKQVAEEWNMPLAMVNKIYST